MPFRCPDFEQDELLAAFAFYTPMLIAVSYFFTTCKVAGQIVIEKSSQLRVYSTMRRDLYSFILNNNHILLCSRTICVWLVCDGRPCGCRGGSD